MNFMSVTFTAQKQVHNTSISLQLTDKTVLENSSLLSFLQNVVIDACILENESGLLQQACDITGGVYLKIPQISAMLQYLLVGITCLQYSQI